MKLKSLLFLVLGLMSLMIAVTAGNGAYQAWQERSNVVHVAEIATIVEPFVKAGRDQLRLRVTTMNQFQNAAGVSGELAAGRKTAQDSLAVAITTLQASREEFDRQTLDDLIAAESELRTATSALESQFSAPPDERDYDVATAWQDASIILAERINTMASHIASSADRGDPVAASYSSLRSFAVVALDYATREQTLLGRVIATEFPFAPDDLVLLSDFRGRIELAWSSMDHGSESDLIDPAITVALATAENRLFEEFGAQREKIYSAGVAGQDYPLASTQWYAEGAAALDSVFAVQDAIAKGLQDYTRDALSAATLQLVFLGGLLLFGLALVGFSIWVVANRVVNPIRFMTDAMQRLAEGDVTIEVPARDRQDEIGQMAGAVEVFKTNAIEKEKLEQDQIKERAAAEERATQERKQIMGDVADGFEAKIKGVLETLTVSAADMEQTAQTMLSGAEHAAQRTETVSTATERTTSNVNTVAASSEELTASIGEISKQMARSTQTAEAAQNQANKSRETVNTLKEAADRIGAIVSLITDIAEQTNLLALNATIEAARAGEAGKGFAVVAGEVKSLATQTASATSDIAEHVTTIQEATQGVVEEIEIVGSTIGEINEFATAIASAIEEQEATTSEIARSCQETATDTQSVSDSIVDLTRSASETGESARGVLEASGAVSKNSKALRDEVDEFLAQLKMA